MRENRKEKQKLRAAQKQENFAQQREKHEADGYAAEELTISVFKANVQALLLSAPFWALGIWLFFRHGNSSITLHVQNALLFFLLYLVSIPVHELLHGLFWSVSCERGFSSIQFGVMEGLTPYCHCMEPLTKRRYLLGAIAPLLLLGILPSAIAIWAGRPFLLLFGLFSITSAGGDMAILLLLLQSKARLFLDHPTKCGFLALHAPTKSEH
ncbi:DUF3267 domain-containing protein [Christensenellaceae bacterium OttesenSCG-928-L17]|nr:DUF3267 domain-containing protein [Christensenellaceae bacterium OttesenSCG-928-L17]